MATGDFARSVATVATGTVVSQGILVLASPFLTRLFTPEQFGALAVFAALFSIITTIASLRYEMAIPLPRNECRAAGIVTLALLCVVGVVGVTVLLVAFYRNDVANWTRSPALSGLLWFLPASAFFGGVHKVLVFWAGRINAFSRVARSRVLQASIMVISQLLMGMTQLGAVGLILGHAAGQIAGTSLLLRTVGVDAFRLGRSQRREKVLAVARRYKHFPIYSAPAGLVNTLGSQLLPLALAGIFSPAVAGFYMLADRVGSRPTILIGQAVAQVFLPNAAKARRVGNLGSLTTKAFAGLLRVGILPIALLTIVAPDLFGIVFGPNWVEAGVYLRWLSPWLAAQFVISPFTILFAVLERQRMGLTMQSTLFGVRLVSIVVGAMLHNVEVSLAIFGISSAAVFLIFGMRGVSLAGGDLRKLTSVAALELLSAVGIAVVIIVAAIGINWAYSVNSQWVTVLLSVFVGGPVVLWRIRRVLLGLSEAK